MIGHQSAGILPQGMRMGGQPSLARLSVGRRSWTASALMVLATLLVAVTSYSFSLSVSNERADLDRVRRSNAALESELRALDAELRVRARMPQVQRWNDEVLGLLPITAEQYLARPVLLAAYAVDRPVPAGPPAVPARPLLASVPPAFTPARPLYAAAMPASAPVAAPGPARTAPAPERPRARNPVVAVAVAEAPAPVAARGRAPRAGGFDPLLVAAIDRAARLEAAVSPADRPADLLTQISLGDAVSADH